MRQMEKVVYPPQFGLLGDKLIHELGALGIVQHHDVDSARSQVGLAPDIILVLANDDPADAVEEAGSCACWRRRTVSACQLAAGTKVGWMDG